MEIKIEEAMAHNHPLPNNYSRHLLVLEKGEGCYVEDIKGNRYLDFGSGIAVNSLGYGRKDLARIAAAQMEKIIHTSNLYVSKPALRVAAKLIGLGNFSAVHFGNSGAEANEAAIKYARLYSLRTKGEGHHKILAFDHSFHGRTMGALSATATEKYKIPFYPLVPGFEFCEYNNVEKLEAILDESFAAVIVEPIQGEGGINPATKEFASKLNELCEKYNIILIADEVQTGVGRTGLPLASAWVGLKPDIVNLAKPLAGGLPFSATLIPAKVNDLIHEGEHGGTFGGGPVTSALVDAILDTVLDPEFLKQVQAKGEFLEKQVDEMAKELPYVKGCCGYGLLRGIVIEGIDPSAVCEKAMRKGLLVLRSGTNKIRIAPPLIINEEELIEGMNIIKETLIELNGEIKK